MQVVQWTTGNVGKRSVRAVVGHPDLELVGCYAWSADKVGRDVGELCGIDPVGVTATDDVDALLALRARLRRLQPDVARHRRGRPHPRGRRQRGEHRGVHQRPGHPAPTASASQAACERGGSSMFGTGISPGFVELIGIAAAEHLRPDRQARHRRGRPTPPSTTPPPPSCPCGFGRPIDDPELPGMAAEGTAVFGEAVAMVADALGVELDEIVCEAEYAKTTEDVVMDSWTIPAGCVAGVAASWQGRVGDRTVVELNVRWKKGQTLDPTWDDRGGPRHPDRGPAHGHGARSSTSRRRTSRPPRSPTSWSSG